MPNEVKLLPCDYPVSESLVVALDDLRTKLHEHDGGCLECVYCRIFDHVNAAFGEAIGEPIDSRPTTVVTDEVVERVSRALYGVFADLAREDGAATIPDYDRDDAEARDFTIRLARAALASMPTVVTGEQPGWQPIESAPKDGDDILVHWDQRLVGPGCLVVSWDDDPPQPGWSWATLDGPYYCDSSFSHWQPLPEPPAQPGDA